MTRDPTRSGLVLLTALALAGCTLIDQRTFERSGKSPEAADLARANLPKLPLLTIRFDNADVDFQGSVNEAVEAAQAVKPDCDFDVVFPIPTSATEQVQDKFTQLGAEDTAKVVTALGYAGVSMDHVHVGYRGDAGAPPVEVSLYVR
jgi:hypothetical protein